MEIFSSKTVHNFTWHLILSHLVSCLTYDVTNVTDIFIYWSKFNTSCKGKSIN